MSNTAKNAITSWWILAMISLFLWYRNITYDRTLSVFIFLLGIIELIEYGILCGTDPAQSKKTIFITLWLQCLVLAIGSFILLKNNPASEVPSTRMNIITQISAWNIFLFAIIFIVAVITTLMSNPINFMSNTILGQWEWLYAIGILLPLFLIFGYLKWADIGIALIIIYIALALVYIKTYCTSLIIINYLIVGFAFISWIIGIIPEQKIITD